MRTKQEGARRALDFLGRNENSEKQIYSEAVAHIGLAVDVEELLMPTLTRFEEVEVEEAWTTKRHPPNHFERSFYQGLASFSKCVDDATEDFIRPGATKVFNDVAATLDEIPQRSLKDFHGKSAI